MNHSYSLTDGPLASASARHAATMDALHCTVRVNVETGDIERGIKVPVKAQMPFRSNDKDDYGHVHRARDARDAIERLWQRHKGTLEHFDDAGRLPKAQWSVIGRDELVDGAGGRRFRPRYRLVGVTGQTTLPHDCTKHVPDTDDGGHWEPTAFVMPHTGFRRVA